MGDEGPLSQAMTKWPHQIEKFDQQYNKAFAGDPIFGADIIDSIHKWVQASLHLCKMTCLDNVELGALTEFGDLQKCVEQGK